MSSDREPIEAAREIPECSLRPMVEEDVAKILPVEKRSYPQPWSETDFLAELHKPYSQQWVLTDDETDERIFGYVVFHHLENAIEILNITVDPEWRTMGFGRKMLHQATSYGVQRRAERLILDVRKSNLAAVHLYQVCGFTIHQIRKGFYSNGEDAFHMVLDLGAENPAF